VQPKQRIDGDISETAIRRWRKKKTSTKWVWCRGALKKEKFVPV